MTDDIRRFAFLLRQMPICTQSPIKTALGPDKHRELRAKYKLALGLDLLDDRCPNSFNCLISDSNCIGRPFPIDVEIKQALDSINVQVTKGIFKGREVYLADATLCDSCPFRASCANPCATQESYLKRSTRTDLSPKGTMLVSFDDFEKGYFGEALNISEALSSSDKYDDGWRSEELPLDCLTEQQRLIVKGIVYEGKTQVQLGYELEIAQQLISDQYSASISKMSEFALARKYLKLHGGTARVRMYYLNNMIEIDIALIEGVSQQAINKTLTEWRKKYGI